MFKIPQQQNWIQDNNSYLRGNIVESFNIDLEANRGVVRGTRAKLITSGDGSLNNFGYTAAILYFSNKINVFSGNTSGDNLYEGGNSPFDTLTGDTTSTNVDINFGDASVFNGEIYATDGTNINRYNGSTENSVSSGLTDSTPHLTTVFDPDGNGERLYVTNNQDQVFSVSQANSLATSGSYTLDLSLGTDYQITFLEAGEDRIWIGVSTAGNNSSGERSIVLEWDGVTENTPNAKYYINASRIMAGKLREDVPFVVDSRGRLMAFNGGMFKEIARFPLGKGTFINTSSNFNQNAIHPKGMAVDEDELLICASNLQDGSSGTTNFYNDFPAGVWAWNPRNGLYHKYSPSYQAVADTGTTNLTDYGQLRTAYGGPVAVFETQNPVAADGGRVMFAMSYFADGTDDLSNLTFGIWTDDTKDNTQKASYIITPKIPSSRFRDIWQKAYPNIQGLESGDRFNVKYRIDDTEEITTATWTGTDRFNTNDELTSFEEGDEVQILHGTGGGACENIEFMTTGSGSTVALKSNITGVTGTSKVKLTKFKKICELSENAKQGYTIGEEADWIQFKIYTECTGAVEFYNLLVENTSSITG